MRRGKQHEGTEGKKKVLATHFAVPEKQPAISVADSFLCVCVCV